jgi:two-component system chemotaxis sensor kinase CheA
VNVDTLEHLMTMVSELVLTRNQLLEISRRHEDTEFKVPLQRLSTVTAELQDGVMKTRMQPIGNAWQKLPRIVRDLGRRTRQADRTGDARRRYRTRPPGPRPDQGSAHPHGAQLARIMASKRRLSALPPASRSRARSVCPPITRAATSLICIADNGRGLDTERIKAKAISNGLATEAEIEKMSEAQIHKLHLRTGLLDGRCSHQRLGPRRRHGRGAHQYRSIGGTIDIKSVAGEGSSVTIKIPLTLAIVSALIVEAGGIASRSRSSRCVELVRARANAEHRIERIKDTPVLRLRNKLLPLMHLKKLLQIDDGSSADPENGFIVVTQVGNQTSSASSSTASSTPKKSSSSRCPPSSVTSACSPATPSWAMAR